VASIALTSPAGTQQLALSPPEDATSGPGGAFIAVFDDATTNAEQLTLVVTLKNGTTQTSPNPRSVNLRRANGQPL
jgi:hypothetical protein